MALGLLGYLDNQLSALYSFFGGYIGERLGMKRALRLFNVMAMAGYALIITVPSWPTAILGAMLFISWTAISLPFVVVSAYRVNRLMREQPQVKLLLAASGAYGY